MEWWIKIHRKISSWWWYWDINVFGTFIHCLILANWKDKIRKGIEIKRGSFITSISHLAKNVWITPKQIRLSLEKLKKGKEIDIQTTNKYTLITVVWYDKYQIDENEKANKGQTDGQTEGKQRATTKEIQEYKNKENMFEKLWSDFPHARTSSKKTTKQNYLSSSLSSDAIEKEIRLLHWLIEFGIQDASYVKAMERWIRDITPTSETILTTHLKKIISAIRLMEWEKRRDAVDRFKAEFWVETAERLWREVWPAVKVVLKLTDWNKVNTYS